MSRFTIRPWGPEPWTAPKSTPACCAMRLAKGDARRRPSPDSLGRSCTTCAGALARAGGGGTGASFAAGVGGAGGAWGASEAAGLGGEAASAAFFGAAAAAGTASPLAPMKAMGAPTWATSPAGTRIFRSTPSS